MRITGLCLGIALLARGFPAFAAGGPASTSATSPAPPRPAATLPAYEPFTNLPPPMTRPAAAGNRSQLHPGTAGLDLPAPAAATGTRTTLAILGDLAPGDPAQRDQYLRMAVSEIALLRPDAVLTTGNLIPGLTRSPTAYVEQMHHLHTLLDDLPMPWFPCAGFTDTFSGTRDPADHRFEDLYQRYAGPLYFSADIGGGGADTPAGTGGLHVIVLDSQDDAGKGVGESQLLWLRADLNRTFNLGRAQGVLLVLGRPLWQIAPANWDRLHNLLLEFNRKPIASFEGGGTAPPARGPRVLAVFAGGNAAYDQEPLRDGIHYVVLGPTAAAPRDGQEREALRHFTLVKFDAAGELHTALVRLGGATPDAPDILPEDFITAPQRAVLDAIAQWNDAAFGIDGVVDDRGTPLSANRPLNVHFNNPLSQALDVQFRLPPDGNWESNGPAQPRHLTAAAAGGASVSADFSLRRIHAGTDLPVVEALVRWPDPFGRVHELILRRHIAVAPSVDLSVADKTIPLNDPAGWNTAPAGTATAWDSPADRPAKPDPTIALRADGDRLLVQVHVVDGRASYWPAMKLDPAWGGLASDAVSLAWAKNDRQVKRLWLLPFAPAANAPPASRLAAAPATTPVPELWTNTGLGDRQTPLQPLDPKLGVQALVTPEPGGYTVVFSLPRSLICDEIPAAQPGPAIPLLTPPPPPTRIAATTLLNLAVHDNDQSARTWTKSWTLEDAGPDAWAHIQLIQSSPPQPGLHLP